MDFEYDTKWTTDTLVEYTKCKDDIFYFAAKYFYIKSYGKSKKLIKLYDCQKRAIETILENKHTAIVATRQCGKTLIETVVALWSALFKKDYKILIMAVREDPAKEILDCIKRSYEALPIFLKLEIKNYTKEYIEFTNGSKIIVSTTSGCAVRGQTLDLIILDEFAHVRSEIAEDLYKSVIPTISNHSESKLVILSSRIVSRKRENTENMFNKIFEYAEAHPDEWGTERIQWYDVPGRNKDWKNNTLKILGNDKKIWASEYNCQLAET